MGRLSRNSWYSLLGAAALAAFASGAFADEEATIATFACRDGKTIRAAFYSDEVNLALSDGRTMTLPQVRSGSGIRYANEDESFVFWSRGNTAFVTEGKDETETFADCIKLADVSGGEDWASFASPEFGFSIRYPNGYAVNTAYRYEGLGPGKEIAGVSFTVPQAMTTGTNLASDTRLSVETLPDAEACTANLFLPGTDQPPRDETQNDVEYSVATFNDAGAGNFYEQQVYALVGAAPCLAVRYFIHSLNIDNFDPGTVREFDKPALIAEFDKIRRSLVIGR